MTPISTATSLKLPSASSPQPLAPKLGGKDSPELREAFQDFVGQSFFSQVLSEMRKSVGKPAYFHGGMGEEMFQQQLDQILVERMSEASSEQFSEPMYDLFMLGRQS
jgi:peptidoglycan hydrolase FlgJ